MYDTLYFIFPGRPQYWLNADIQPNELSFSSDGSHCWIAASHSCYKNKKKTTTEKKMLLMSCYNYTYYSTLWVRKQPINRWGCTLWGWCAPNSPLGCTESHNISVGLPPRLSVFVFRPSFFLFFFTPLVARTAEWQNRCCKDHLVSGKVSSI